MELSHRSLKFLVFFDGDFVLQEGLGSLGQHSLCGKLNSGWLRNFFDLVGGIGVWDLVVLLG